MRLRHFEALKPICPLCRREGRPDARLGLAATFAKDEGGGVVEGLLLCPSAACRREYPIVDGVPMLLAGLRAYVESNALAMLAREDLSPEIESVIGDCAGAGSAYGVARQQVSSYVWDHYGDLDPEEGQEGPRPGSIGRLLERGLEMAATSASTSTTAGAGPAIDIGCAVGRGAFALAERTGGIVLGVDLHWPLLRFAAGVLARGEVVYARRRVGLVHDRRRFAARFASAPQVDFWACDAAALPFADGTFALAAALNVIDCTASPRELLASIARVLSEGGKAVLSTPYDWSPAATPVESWLGGHSQRSPDRGASEPVLRALLGGAHPGAIADLRLAAEGEAPWHVRLHDRSVMTYGVHVVVAEKDFRPPHPAPPPPR